ncbi:MAG: alpha/beta hydrolase [Gemmatimonadota bacterium]|nr:alpha/beta hydrolase [Gemmatimonadota bacterium]
MSSPLYADDGGGGDATPVVCLHSLAGNTTQWHETLAHLRSTRRAIAIDWRGHGKSATATDTNFDPAAVAEEIEQAIDAFGLEEFALVAHSAGAIMGLALVLRNPARIAGLVLVDPAGDSSRVPGEQTDALLETLASDAYGKTIEAYWNVILAGASDAAKERVLADLRSTKQSTVVGVPTALRDYDPLPALESYNGPTLAIITRFNETPVSLHRLFPSLPHVTIAGTGHWPQIDQPHEFQNILDEFLTRVDAIDGHASTLAQ